MVASATGLENTVVVVGTELFDEEHDEMTVATAIGTTMKATARAENLCRTIPPGRREIDFCDHYTTTRVEFRKCHVKSSFLQDPPLSRPRPTHETQPDDDGNHNNEGDATDEPDQRTASSSARLCPAD